MFRPDQTGFRRTLDFINLRRAYGQSLITDIRRFVSLTTRVAAFKSHLDFNLTCKRKGLIPRSLHLNRPVPSSFGFSVVAKAERLLLQARINNCRDDIRKLENEAFFARRHLEFHCPDHFVSIQLYANHQAKLRSLEAEDAHEVKLARLSGSTKLRRPEGSTVTVHNLSTYRLDPAESSVLELGLNFNTGPASDVRRVICAAENAVNQVHQSHRDEARTRVVGVLSRLRQRKFPSPLSADERGAIKRLRENGEIVILPADKGNATVVLDTAVYKRKMLDLLED